MIVIALVAVLGLMAVFHSFNVNGVINLITMIAIAMPIVYFVMMLHSKKVTKLERKRVVAYIPLFIAAAIFWGLKSPVPWSWPSLPSNGRSCTSGVALCRR